jgi:hypothetical protein
MNPGQYGAPQQGSPYGAQQPQQQQLQQQQPQYQQQQPQYASPPAASALLAKAGFFKGLMDLSFSTLITPSIIKVIYVILALGAAGFGIFLFGSGVMGIIKAIEYEHYNNIVLGLGMIVLSPFAFILYVIVARIYMELLMVIFRISNDLRELNQKTRG